MAEPTSTKNSEKESEALKKIVRKADHFSDFGTLTSLISTAFYFVEQALSKKLPKWVNNLSLGAVGVGIAAIFTSFYYRMKAGDIALHSSAHIDVVTEANNKPSPEILNSAKDPEETERTQIQKKFAPRTHSTTEQER